MADNRHKVVKHFRFTESEARTLRKHAKKYGMTDSDYMRFILSQKPADYQEIRLMLSGLINEINHIGNNINQIARKNNAGFYSHDDMESLRCYMRKLINATREVEKKIGSNEGT